MRPAPDNIVDTEGAIIVGAGVAGLFTALKLIPFPALVLTAARPGASGSSAWAQGGIAAALGPGDSWASHAADTLSAAAGIGEPDVAQFVAREASERIDDLIVYGAHFDRKPDGTLALAREAAHAMPRIVHVSGDRAGAEITHALARAALSAPSISLIEGIHALELAVAVDGRVIGLFGLHGTGGEAKLVLFRAPAVVVACGGIGALYAVTTNPPDARGEGLGMAARAGALIADPEFVQFHPTAIDIGRDPAPLATEALRGEGAVLVDERGHTFMSAVHPAGELAPRDVVARAIHRENGRGHRVFLDCRTAVGHRFSSAFPTVYAACRSAGIDPAKQPIPVVPAAHYHMGGIASDHHGRSSLEGLWCVGECACTGLHGANRLASNSLLEALVFGARVADDVKDKADHGRRHDKALTPPSVAARPLPKILRQAMTHGAGLERDASGLKKTLAAISGIEASASEPALLNVTAAAKLIAAAALARSESLGAHFRRDHPLAGRDPGRSFLTLADAEEIARESGAAEPGQRRQVP
ncbi:MAG TPA: L-aspartate oxidase [Rhizomicrobium sp.]|jgi:L-aspartate oxidase|nr:L-aspartate oxidase [Rhizomicrobium sp.]